ncbi:MAG: NAD(P)/FAD-dependent oxidoreductase, partial [Gammaproteobacteria bacterium]|nr:NAD(P)/FAD-dependent oxidoreductase [Gammaproteobacteria bacterium]
IRPAIESGLIASDIIHRANGDYRYAKLAAYSDEIQNRFGDRKSVPGVSNPFTGKLKQHLAGSVMRSTWFLRHVLINRWFLHTDQLPLPVAALKN